MLNIEDDTRNWALKKEPKILNFLTFFWGSIPPDPLGEMELYGLLVYCRVSTNVAFYRPGWREATWVEVSCPTKQLHDKAGSWSSLLTFQP